jgi:lipopolysaccharide export system permease protein
MGIIDRYMLREFWAFFAFAFCIATFVLLLDKLLGLISLVLSYHLDWLTTVRFLTYTLSTVSGFTLPMAMLIGCTLAFNRLSMDSEYVVLKAAGLSLYRLLLPFLVVGGIMYVLSNFFLMYVSPWGLQGMRHLLFDVARNRAQYHLRAHEFDDAFRGLVVYVERVQPEERQLQGVFIADSRTALPQVLTAREGELLTYPGTLQVILRLKQGHLHRYLPAQKRYQWLYFDRYDVRLDLDTWLAQKSTAAIRPRELFPAQLHAEIAQQHAAGEDVRPLVLFWHQRFALPFACFIFAGLGPSLGIVHTRSGRSGGYVLGIGAIFAYYLCLTASKVVGERTDCPPLLAAWLPNLCMGCLTLWLLFRLASGAMLHDRPVLRRRSALA